MKDFKKLIEKAEDLRTKKSFPMNLFSSPDYLESAELFFELGDGADREVQIKCYTEAANTYLMLNSSYGLWKAAEAYKTIYRITKENTFLLKNVECLELGGKYMLAGQTLLDGAKEEEPPVVIDFHLRAILNFKKHGDGCKMHLRKTLDDCAALLVKADRISEAIELFKELRDSHGIAHAKLCVTLLSFTVNQGACFMDDDLSIEENKVIMGICNDSDKSAVLNNYLNNNVCTGSVKTVMQYMLDSFKPENDIC